MAAAGETRIHLCGLVSATIGGRRIEAELRGRQGRILFAFLALNRTRPVARAALAGAVWPEEAPDAIEAGLSALLSKLRRTLGEGVLEGRSELRLVLPDGAWVDVEAAAEALHRASAAAGRQDWPATWVAARVTQHIAARGFLPGEDAPWIAQARGRLDAQLERALELAALASLRIGGGELETAERTARALVALAPYGETGYRLLMETLAARGERARALLVFDELRGKLRDDLGASPSPETQQLHRTMLV